MMLPRLIVRISETFLRARGGILCDGLGIVFGCPVLFPGVLWPLLLVLPIRDISSDTQCFDIVEWE